MLLLPPSAVLISAVFLLRDDASRLLQQATPPARLRRMPLPSAIHDFHAMRRRQMLLFQALPPRLLAR